MLDEVQFMPGLFAALRPEIDALRRPGRFLLLGSASGDMLRQSAESLAWRVGYLELTPLLAAELRPDLAQLQSLWLRGGFPLSYLAPDEAASYTWRHLISEIPQPFALSRGLSFVSPIVLSSGLSLSKAACRRKAPCQRVGAVTASPRQARAGLRLAYSPEHVEGSARTEGMLC